MAEEPINFAKERLDGSDLLPRTIYYNKDDISLLLYLYVKNYAKLKKNTIYYTSAKVCEYRWTVKLVIRNGTFFTFMSTNANMENSAACIFKIGGDSTVNKNFRQSGSLLILEFCHKAIMDSTNEYMHGNTLLIQFKYEMKLSKNDHCSTISNSFQTLIDKTAHCVEFRDLYFPYLRADIRVYASHIKWYVHTALLTKNSKFFADLFQKKQLLSYKNPYIVINEDPHVFQLVLTYIYNGILDCLDEGNMMKLYRIANILQIDSLEKKCMEYFETNLSASNVIKILEFATMYGLSNLKEATLLYKEKKRDSVMLRSPRSS